MLKVLLPLALLGCCSLWAMAPQDQAPVAGKPAVSAEEALVKEILKVYTDTFNKHDAAALVEYWSEKAVSVNSETGTRLVGRDAIKKGFEELFKTTPGARLSSQVNHFRFLKPDLLTLEGTDTLVSNDSDPVENNFTALLVKVGDKKWVIEHATESPVPTPETPFDGLKNLDWMVGSWKDSTEGVNCESTVTWNEKKTFLIRKFSVQLEKDGDVETGSQVIGWDPRSKSIRSWTFSSDGSFGEGAWSVNEGEWRVRFNHTNSDGSVLSGTQVITRIDDNTTQVELVGQEIDGILSPSSPAVRMVRQAAVAAPVAPKE
jgi:uncharacterized protein (TIGR02246 family)